MPANQIRKIAIASTLFVVIFVADVLNPSGYAYWLLYLAPLLVASSAINLVYLLPLIGTLLIISGFFLSPVTNYSVTAIVNRSFGISVLWLLAFVVAKHKQTQEALERSYKELEKRVEERTLTLEEVNTSLRREIDERKRTEKELVESERRFRKLFEQAAVGVAQIDPISGRFIQVNKRYCDIVGFSLDEMLKTNFQSITHPDDLEADLRNMKSLIAGEINEFSMDKRYIKKDGGLVWVHLTVYATWLSGESPIHHIAIVEDITERRQAEEALRARETQLSMIYDGVYDIIFMVAVEPQDSFRFVSVNRRFLDATGLAENQVVGRLAKDVIPEPSRSIVLGKYREAVQGGHSVQWEEVTSYPSGEKVGEVSVAPVFDLKGICTQLIGTVHDITDRKLADAALRRAHEELEQKVIERTRELSEANMRLQELDRLKSMFIASMSHELRTPLNSIIGFTDMTLQGLSGELNSEQKDNISRVYQSAKHLLSLISDIIDISKIEAGRVEVYSEEFPLREMIDDAVVTIEPQLKEKGLTLEVGVLPDTMLNTDRKRLLQCLINFLSNAVKFTESGGITVVSQATDEKVSLSVSDTGIGIAEKDIPRLFEPFERLETRLKVKAGGTGLGLYLTKRIAADILRGNISVRSTEGLGSTFTIIIPRDIQEFRNILTEQSGGDIL